MKVIPHEFVLKDFEAHDHTTENLLAMDGDLIVGMAPAGDLQRQRMWKLSTFRQDSESP